ncbi:unnamed protein product, partial [Didymodactylos carnosus]
PSSPRHGVQNHHNTSSRGTPTPPPPPPPLPHEQIVTDPLLGTNSITIDPYHYSALQDTNQALKAEVQRLAKVEEENRALSIQLEQYNDIYKSYRNVQNELVQLRNIEVQKKNLQDELEQIRENEKTTLSYLQHENDQLRSQNENLLTELTRLTELDGRERLSKQKYEQENVENIKQLDELRLQNDELKLMIEQLKLNDKQGKLQYDTDIRQINDENLKHRTTNEQLKFNCNLLKEELEQMKEQYETIIKRKSIEHENEMKFLQNENKELKQIDKLYDEQKKANERTVIEKKKLENDLLTMNTLNEQCAEFQALVDKLQNEIKTTVSYRYR